METEKLKIYVTFCIITCQLFQWSCGNDNSNISNHNNDSSAVTDNKTNLIINNPKHLALYTLGDKVDVRAEIPGGIKPDTVSILINNKPQEINKTSLSNSIKTDSCHTGKNNIQINIWSGGKQYLSDVTIILMSNMVPHKYSYKIIKTYPHDSKAYTQGLIFDNGFIYEGTGQYSESTLRKNKLQNNELIQSYNLHEDVFGVGIVIYKKRIFQLTWQSGIAYEFDKESFKLINKFNFSTEGWGITNLGNNFVMSDGSNTLYVLNPETFSEISRIEVYDNIGPVNQLNELELIDGMIYANVYQTDFIVIIEPSTGRVTGKIDCTSLLNKTKVKTRIDVLNGIAWDEQGKRLFLTGKYWPEMYEVQLLKK